MNHEKTAMKPLLIALLVLTLSACTSNASINDKSAWYAGVTVQIAHSKIKGTAFCISDAFNSYGVSHLSHYSAYYYPTIDGQAVQLSHGGAKFIVANVDIKDNGLVTTSFQYVFGMEHPDTAMVNTSIENCTRPEIK
jgi:hypothetical protein